MLAAEGASARRENPAKRKIVPRTLKQRSLIGKVRSILRIGLAAAPIVRIAADGELPEDEKIRINWNQFEFFICKFMGTLL